MAGAACVVARKVVRGFKTEEECVLDGGRYLVEVGRGLGRSSLSRGCVFAVSQDTPNDGGLSDEGDDLHLSRASWAGQRIDFVNFAN